MDAFPDSHRFSTDNSRPAIVLGGVIAGVLLLATGVLGVESCVLSLALYSLAFALGRGVHGRLRVLPPATCAFEGLGIAAFEVVLGLGILVLAALVSRWLGLPDGPLLIGAVVAATVLWPRRRGGRLTFRFDELTSVNGWAVAGFLAAVVVAVFLVGGSMLYDGNHYYFRDNLHTLYALSIAKSTEFPGLVPPDLSYAGKPLHYHLLGPLWVSILERTAGLEGLHVVNRVVPLWQLSLTLVLIAYLARRVTGDDGIAAVTAVAFLALSRFVAAPLGSAVPLPHITPVNLPLHLALLFQPSVGLAFPALLSLLALLVASDLREPLQWRVVVLGGILAVLAFFSKAPYIVPLMGTMGILGVLDLVRTRRWHILALTGVWAAAMLPFVLSLRGAHSHNFWSFIPHPIAFVNFLGPLDVGHNLARQMRAWILAYPAGALGLFGFLPLGIIAGWWVLVRGVSWRPLGDRARDMRGLVLLFGSAALAVVVASALSELSEFNHVQLAAGYLWVGWLGLAVVFFRVRMPGWLRLVLVCFFVVLGGYNVAQQLSPLATASRWPAVQGRNPWLVAMQWRLADGIVNLVGNRGSVSERPPVFSQNAYLTLREVGALPRTAVILRGRHYEDYNWTVRTRSTDWGAGTSFWATAVSGRQFVVESDTYKGLSLEPDYIERSEAVFRFYWHCVERTPENSQGWDLAPGPEAGDRAEDRAERLARLRLVEALRLTGDASTFTTQRRLHHMLARVSSEVIHEKYTGAERLHTCRRILDRYGVTHVLFERGERPDPTFRDELGLKPLVEHGDVALYAYSQHGLRSMSAP